MPANGGEARKLTSLVNGAGPALWSPDSSQILFAALVLKETPPGDPEARARWDQRPKVVTRAQYKDDGQGYTFDAVSQLFVIPADGGEARQLTQGDDASRAPAWSPDGRQVAFSRLRGGVADYNLSDIWVAGADGGSAHRISETVGRATSPTWSPDGSLIACYGTERQDALLGDPLVHVWIVPAKGGEPRALTLVFDRGTILLAPPATTPGPAWSADGQTVTFIAGIDGNAHIVRAAVADAQVKPLVGGERQITSCSVSHGSGRMAFTATNPLNPSDIYACAGDGSLPIAWLRRYARLSAIYSAAPTPLSATSASMITTRPSGR